MCIMSNRFLMIIVSYKMKIHPPLSHEFEEKDKSKNVFVWPHLQNHILLKCLQILTKLIDQQNTQRVDTDRLVFTLV